VLKILNFVPQIPPNKGFSAQKLDFVEGNFTTRKNLLTEQSLVGFMESLTPCHNATSWLKWWYIC